MAAGLAQDPLPDGNDEAGLLGDGNEVNWADLAEDRVRPAQESLKAEQVHGGAVEGLIVKAELVVGQGAAKRIFKGKDAVNFIAERCFITLSLVATGLLGGVESNFSVAQQDTCVLLVGSGKANAYAGGGGNTLPVNDDGLMKGE